MSRRVIATAAGLVAATLAFAANPAGAATFTPGQPCAGDPIAPTQVIEGSFPSSLQGSYVLVPFTVPKGTTAVRIKYCYDQPDGPTRDNISNTLDLGLYEPLRGRDRLAGPAEFRGWGGSSHPDVTVSPQGFSTSAQYLARPKGNVPGRSTRGFEPGPIPPGRWAAELGVASVASQAQGDSDGRVAWRVELELSSNPAYARNAYRPARYDTRPARTRPGWYAGDMHLHAEHSNLGAATMRETFDYAFRPLARGGAGLDFLTLSDYVSDTAWGEIGRYQRRYGGKLIERSAEVITYRGHTNNHGSHTYVDYRTGPVYELTAAGGVTRRRGARPASAIFDAVHRAGGWTQINHPTIFPSSTPAFRSLCRGCPWDYTARETNYAKVDAIEVDTGPAGLGDPLAPNPFTLDAITFYDRALASGHHIAAVGSSDSHKAGRADNPTETPVGQATTVVYADELSEKGLERAVKAGHTYVKLFGNAGPDIRFEARVSGVRRAAIMGDTVRGRAAFTARVMGGLSRTPPKSAGPITLYVVKNGAKVRISPVISNSFALRFSSTGPGRYRLQLERGPPPGVSGAKPVVEAVSSPIYVR